MSPWRESWRRKERYHHFPRDAPSHRKPDPLWILKAVKDARLKQAEAEAEVEELNGGQPSPGKVQEDPRLREKLEVMNPNPDADADPDTDTDTDASPHPHPHPHRKFIPNPNST